MNKIAMSRAAAGLIRALLARGTADRRLVLLTDYRSTEWHSLTFTGERHEISLHVTGPEAAGIAAAMLDGIEEAEFTIPDQIVADIAVARPPSVAADGSVRFDLEALTIAA